MLSDQRKRPIPREQKYRLNASDIIKTLTLIIKVKNDKNNYTLTIIKSLIKSFPLQLSNIHSIREDLIGPNT